MTDMTTTTGEITSINGLGVSLQGVREDIAEMKVDIREMTQALNKLAMLEQQHLETKNAMERAFKRIEGVEADMKPFQAALPGLLEMRKLAMTLLVGAFAVILIALAALVVRTPATVLPVPVITNGK